MATPTTTVIVNGTAFDYATQAEAAEQFATWMAQAIDRATERGHYTVEHGTLSVRFAKFASGASDIVVTDSSREGLDVVRMIGRSDLASLVV